MKINKGFLAVTLLLLGAGSASAETLIRFGTGGSGIDVQRAPVGVLGADGTTDLDFVGSLSSLTDIELGRVLISSINVYFPQQTGNNISALTIDGRFDFFNSAGQLLLGGWFGDGLLSGSTTSGEGSLFTTETALASEGSLLSYLNPTVAGINYPGFGGIRPSQLVADVGLSFSLSSLTSFVDGALTPGLQILATSRGVGGVDLYGFTADATGALSSNSRTAVPEPATMTLLLGGLVAAGRRRSKQRI